MARTRKTRSAASAKKPPPQVEISSEDEIENTNSSIVEVPVTSTKRPSVLLIASDDDDNEASGLVTKRANVVRQGEVSLSILTKKLLSRANSEVQEAQPISSIDKDSWIDKYAPMSVNGLAMHPKKLKEIESSLREMITGESGTKILLLTGPAGSGKSTSVKLICDELMKVSRPTSRPFFQRAESESDSDDEYSGNYNTHESENVIEYINAVTSTADQFTNFLNECKLFTGPNLKVVLVEDLPNVFHLETKLKFQKSLEDWLAMPYKLPPLVICISENEANEDEFTRNGEMQYNIANNFVAETIMGQNVLNNARLKRVKVNPIAKTYLKKALLGIVNQEPIFNDIPKRVIESKLDNFCLIGDIRSAINCLEFWSRHYSQLNGHAGVPVDDEFLSFGKEHNLNLFNAVGKIIYGTAHGDTEVINYQKSSNIEAEELDATKIDQITIANVLNNFSNKASFFNLNLLENYAMLNSGNFPICEELDNFVDNLSISDVVNAYNLQEIGANISIRSGRFNMRSIDEKINDGSYNMAGTSNYSKYKNQKANFSRHYKYLKRYKDTKNDIKNFQFWKFNKLSLSGANEDYGPIPTSISITDAILIDGFLQPSILNSTRNENKIRAKIQEFQKVNYVPSSAIPKFPRLGGSFANRLISDTQIVMDDDYQSFHADFENYKSLEEKMLGVVTNGMEGDVSEEDSEFENDSIKDEEEEEEVMIGEKDIEPKKPKNEFLDDFLDDDSFGDENW